jgi:hypothetical protein
MRAWEKAEKKVARKIGGRVSPGSGNGYLEGDVKNDSLLVEMKETSRPYMTFHIDWLYKILDEATRNRRIPVLGIEFGDGTQIFIVPNRYVDTSESKLHNWMNRSTTRIRPGDLEEEDVIHTVYGKWTIVSIDALRILSGE